MTTVATEPKATKTEKAKKERKVRELQKRFYIVEPHAKYEGLCQAFDGKTWVMVEPKQGFWEFLPKCSEKTAEVVRAVMGASKGLVITPIELPEALTVFYETDATTPESVDTASGVDETPEVAPAKITTKPVAPE